MKQGTLLGAVLPILLVAGGTLLTSSLRAEEDKDSSSEKKDDDEATESDSEDEEDEAKEEDDPEKKDDEDEEKAEASAADAADTKAEKKVGIGADLHVGLPVGNLADIGTLGFGPKIRAEYWLRPNLAVGLRVGFIYHLENNDANFSYIPVQVGARYFFSEPRAGVFAGLELGPNFSTTHFEVLGVSRSSSGTDFGLQLRGGYALREMPLDISAGLTFIDVGQLSDTIVFGVEGGYTFAGF